MQSIGSELLCFMDGTILGHSTLRIVPVAIRLDMCDVNLVFLCYSA